MKRQSFERFYLEKIALGEGCGCAEHVTRIRELDALGERVRNARSGRSPQTSRILAGIRRLWTAFARHMPFVAPDP
ncbi:hypothetical protein GN330_10210 [Nitratireductor sp. CAU 1489]|uniref:Uncharacterized protein n=1 Tax=Nitratireductor arenosus TaxID=2682096 RepID=A0A844QEZ3_9HYPH|nr:hypothetical protein [Nitratireductor arenosus]MVA97617.1 hypothetical protein [Nitratireductor arenosus]